MSTSINFIGRCRHTLDAKNRLMVPLTYRKIVQSVEGDVKFYITPGLNKCLAMYPAGKWENMVGKLEGLQAWEFADEGARKFRRIFFGSAEEVVPDKAGRIVIADHLREHAELKKQLVLNGAGDHVEIWDAEQWALYSHMDDGEYERSAREAFRIA